MQAKFILRSDNITISKATKGEDFTEHKNILEKALAGNPCTVRRERGTNTTGKDFLATLVALHFTPVSK